MSTIGHYSNTQEKILLGLNVFASICSFLGASFIIAIGDIINSVGNFMGTPQDIKEVCIMQGLIIQFGDLVSFGWVTAIAWVIYTVITREEPPTKEDVQMWYKRIHFIIWPTAIILTILPLTTESYGPSGGLCWISLEAPGTIWVTICFYIPLWLSIIYVSIVYCKIWNRLHATEKPIKAPNAIETDIKTTDAQRNSLSMDDQRNASSSDILNTINITSSNENVPAIDIALDSDITIVHTVSGNGSTPKSSGGTLQRIKYYPFVLFICYLFATIRRLYEVATMENAPFVLAALHVFFSALLGTGNALLYGLTPAVRHKDAEWLRSKCGRGPADDKGSGTIR